MTRGRRGSTLAQRAAVAGTPATGPADAASAPGPAERPADGSDELRACWVRLADGDGPGHVLAWRRADDGAPDGWSALVVAWVPQSGVRPRP
ncbi:MAG: hypothetical protein R2737_09815 [Candidatus Nanopelagicales bacterium]